MSRVGKSIISIPDGVNITTEKNVVKVKGPKGELLQKLEPGFTININDNTLSVNRPTEQKRHKALHGLYRSLINNMSFGVSEGFTRTLELVGVGYKAEVKGSIIELSLGYSHPIVFSLPPEVKAISETVKGQPPRIILSSFDKQLLGQVVAKLKETRKTEPYKGKGVREQGEYIRRKAGKAGAKK